VVLSDDINHVERDFRFCTSFYFSIMCYLLL